jgi:hypothetical protein
MQVPAWPFLTPHILITQLSNTDQSTLDQTRHDHIFSPFDHDVNIVSLHQAQIASPIMIKQAAMCQLDHSMDIPSCYQEQMKLKTSYHITGHGIGGRREGTCRVRGRQGSIREVSISTSDLVSTHAHRLRFCKVSINPFSVRILCSGRPLKVKSAQGVSEVLNFALLRKVCFEAFCISEKR